MAVFAMEAASVISERSLEISFASALSTVSASGLNVNAGKVLTCYDAAACNTYHGMLILCLVLISNNVTQISYAGQCLKTCLSLLWQAAIICNAQLLQVCDAFLDKLTILAQ